MLQRGQISRAEYEETVRRNRPGEHQSQNNVQITGIVDGTRQQPTAGQEPVLEGWSTIEVDVRLSYCPSWNIIPCFDADEKRLPLPSHL
jgi:hypothetical protein